MHKLVGFSSLLPGGSLNYDVVFDDPMPDGDEDGGDAFLQASSVPGSSPFPPSPLEQGAFSPFSLQDSVVGSDGKCRITGRNLSQRTKSTVCVCGRFFCS